MYNDKTLTCADCGQQFVFTASEQDFYAQRGFTEPRRCQSCRASRKAARGTSGRRRGRLRRQRWLQLRRRLQQRGRWLRRRWRWWIRDAAPVRCSPRPAATAAGGPGPLPPDERQARLLQRLLPEHARQLVPDSSPGRPPSPTRPAKTSDPGRQPPGSFDSWRDVRRPVARVRGWPTSGRVDHGDRDLRLVAAALALAMKPWAWRAGPTTSRRSAGPTLPVAAFGDVPRGRRIHLLAVSSET